MKKLLILLFSLLFSFNSYGLFEKTVCVDTDAQMRKGIIYLPNTTKPFSGKDLCKNENGQLISEGKVKKGKFISQTFIKYNDVDDYHDPDDYDANHKNFEGIFNNPRKVGDEDLRYVSNDRVYRYKDDSWWMEQGDAYYYYLNIKETWWTQGHIFKEKYYTNGLSDGRETEWYRNGQKKSEENYKDDKKDGKWTYWYENGQIQKEENYNNDGIKDGRFAEWYANGQQKLEANFKGDKPDGKFNMWYENGQIQTDCYAKDGKTNGKCTEWYENGQKMYEVNYKDGELDGKDTDWDMNGQIESEKTWQNGVCISGDCD